MSGNEISQTGRGCRTGVAGVVLFGVLLVPGGVVSSVTVNALAGGDTWMTGPMLFAPFACTVPCLWAWHLLVMQWEVRDVRPVAGGSVHLGGSSWSRVRPAGKSGRGTLTESRPSESMRSPRAVRFDPSMVVGVELGRAVSPSRRVRGVSRRGPLHGRAPRHQHDPVRAADCPWRDRAIGSSSSGKCQGQAGGGKTEAKPEALTATIRVASARRANSQRTRPGRSVAVRPQRAMPGLFAVVRNGVSVASRPSMGRKATRQLLCGSVIREMIRENPIARLQALEGRRECSASVWKPSTRM